MARWLRRAAVISVGWVGLASAQQPLTPAGLANTGTAPRPVPAPAPALDEPITLVIRTTGQPERRLKVLKRSSYENGETLVDVQDTMSGERFTLPGAVADRLPRFNGGVVTPSPAPVPQPAPAPQYQPAPPQPAPTYQPALLPQPIAQPPQLVAPAATVPAAPRPSDDFWKPVLQDSAPVPVQPMVPAPVRMVPSPAFTPIPVSPGPVTPVPAPPTAPNDRWKPIPPPSPTPTSATGDVVVRGQMPADWPSERSAAGTGWATGAARTANWTPAIPVVAIERQNREAWLAEIVRREVQPLAEELTTAVRPSARVTAAIGLAEMRYAARPEVKGVLAKAAMTDPADIVRTVCVRALARLGYDDREYVEFLETTAWGAASGDALRVAASAALRQLRPRN